MTLLGKVGKARLPTAMLLLTLMLLKQTSTVGSMTPALEAHSACWTLLHVHCMAICASAETLCHGWQHDTSPGSTNCI